MTPEWYIIFPWEKDPLKWRHTVISCLGQKFQLEKGTQIETEKVPKAKSTIWDNENFIEFL